MKGQITALLLLCILGFSAARSFDENEFIVYEVLETAFGGQKYAKPSDIMNCIDNVTADLLVNSISKIIKESKSIITIMKAVSDAKKLVHTIKPEVYTCVKKCFHAPTKSVQFDQVEITNFLVKNFSQIPMMIQAFNNKQYDVIENYMLSLFNDVNQNTLQQSINGFFEQNKLADPITIIACIDPTDAALIVNFMPGFLRKASSVLTIDAAVNAAQDLVNKLSPQMSDCLSGNAEVASLETVYDVSNINKVKAIAYVTSHISKFTDEFSTLNKIWSQKSFNSFGNNMAAFIHTILNAIKLHSDSELTLTSLEIMQQFYNGLFTQQNLPIPTFIAPCYTDVTASEFVAFAPTFLKDASSITKIQGAFDNLNAFAIKQGEDHPEIKECLTGNQELINFSDAIGVKHPDTVQATIKNYIQSNLFPTTSSFGDASKSWNSSGFTKSGTQVSAWIKKALAKN